MPMPNILKTRPINGGPKAVTQGLSKLIEKILKPLVAHLKTFIKDEWDFLRKFPRKLESESCIICCDVTSLYTSIPNELCIKATEFWINKLSASIPDRFTKSFIIESINFILESNYFIFDDVMYHQIIGTAMGTTFAPPYACLVVGFLEETILFPRLLPSSFDLITCKIIQNHYFR